MDDQDHQVALFEIYSEPTQPEDCLDCEAWLDGRDLKKSWDYCEYCTRSVCANCDSLHACDAMLRARPKSGIK